jgi:hypothetical protein
MMDRCGESPVGLDRPNQFLKMILSRGEIKTANFSSTPKDTLKNAVVYG